MKPRSATPAHLAAIALRHLEEDRTARLFVTIGMDVIWANSAALRMIESVEEIGLREERLWLNNRADYQAMAEKLNAPDPSDRRIIPVAISDGHLLIEVSRGDCVQGEPVFVLKMTLARPSVAASVTHLDQVFGLTLAEYRTLLGLLNGATADVLAVRDGISVETVRTHIRRIYAKMGVSSREAMFARLRPYLVT